MNLTLLWAFLISLTLTWPATYLFRRFVPRWGLVDVPNERSSHTRPVPRAGGVVFVVVVPIVALGWAWVNGLRLDRGDWALLAGGWFVALVSLIDDWRGLPARTRLLAQAWAAGAVILFAGYVRGVAVEGLGLLHWGALGIPLTFIWIIGLTNAYNFMDGIDGLAAGQAVIAGAAAAWLANSFGASWLAILAASLAGGALGFWLHNYPPARVFMGDVGSIWLGFTFAGLAVVYTQPEKPGMPIGVWVILLSPFILDAGLTLARRVLRGEPVWQAHRTHFYQRLVTFGWPHWWVTGLYLALAVVLAALSIVHFGLHRLSFLTLAVFGLTTFAAIVLLVWRIEFSAAQLAARGKGPATRDAHWQFVRRAGIYLLADAVIVAISYYAALLIRFSSGIPPLYYEAWRAGVWAIALVHLTVNAAFGIYSRIWRYASAPDALSVGEATLVSAAVLIGGEVLLEPVRTIPLALIGLGAFFSMAGFTALRYRWRLFAEINRRWQAQPEGRRINTLIVGAGESGQALSWQLQNRRKGEQFRVVGFVDDDPAKIGMNLHGVRIVGGRDDIPRLVETQAVELIIFAITAISGQEFREMLAICQSTPAQIKIAPDVFEGLEAVAASPLVRDVTVEDLLGRSATEIDLAACRSLIAGRVVMVTGGAGSIGSELCRQIADLHPALLVAVDVNETGLYDLDLEIDLPRAARRTASPFVPWIADTTDARQMRAVFEAHRPQIIFHAAAYKHVPLMETFPFVALRVNTRGTFVVAALAREFGVERFVLVSTDKAVNPANVMGATKRLGELLMLAVGQASPTTRFTAVRFGNVLNSRGSVVPRFQRQIDAGGPLTVTHPEIDRYFMSLPEAVRLIVQAATLTQGGDLYMLDMGESIRITDLAERMIRLRGLRPGVDIAVEYTGLRPGEKLHEELISAFETRAPTAHPHIYRIAEGPAAPPRPSFGALRDFVESLRGKESPTELNRLWALIGCEPPLLGSHLPDGRQAAALDAPG